MMDIPKKLKEKLVKREANNALRTLFFVDDLVDFSSNDYLGLARNETIFSMASQILVEKGSMQNGATGSRLLSGNSELFMEVEEMLCDFHQAESALIFNSGYDANVGFFSSVPQRNDIVFYDELAHASIRDGIKLGNAQSYKFKHNDLEDLKLGIERSRNALSRNNETYIVTESVFSMDGDSPDLKALTKFCSEYTCRLIIDEAHAVGVFGSCGQGLLQQLGLEHLVFARIVTFGKAKGCHGAAILGGKELKTYLVNFARSFIYTTGLPPHAIASILASYQFSGTLKGDRMQQKLKENIDFFNLQLKIVNLERHFIPSNSAIHCCILSGNEKVKYVAKTLQEKGFDVKPIISPTIPVGEERLRFCLHSYNTKEEISDVLQILKENVTKSPSSLGRD